MTRVSAGMRVLTLAFALFQLCWAGAAAVADGLARASELRLAAHVEAQGSSHEQRTHSHECVACRALRAEYAPPPSCDSCLPVFQRAQLPVTGLTVAEQVRDRSAYARGPPARSVHTAA